MIHVGSKFQSNPKPSLSIGKQGTSRTLKTLVIAPNSIDRSSQLPTSLMLPCTVSCPWSWVGRGFLTLLLSLEQMPFSRAFQFLPGRRSVCGIVESTHTSKRAETSSQWACSEHYDWLLDLSLPYCPSCFLGNWLTQKEFIWSSKRALSPPFLSCQNKAKTMRCHTPIVSIAASFGQNYKYI